MVIVIHDEPFPGSSFPEFTVIKDQGPTRSEYKEHLAEASSRFEWEPSLDVMLDLVKGMSFHQVDRVLAKTIIASKDLLLNKQPIPTEVLQLAAKDIVPTYPHQLGPKNNRG